MSISWQPADAALLVKPPAAVSLDEAHAAIELWEHYSRKRLDPSQRLVVEVMMAQTCDDRWAASTTGREMSRQNGKGDEVEVVEVWGLVQRGEAILHTVHDAVLLASQTQQRMLAVLEGHADLRRLVKRKWQGTGQQMIEMHNGGAIWYRTRTAGGGRGIDDVDRLVVDEAQHATADHLAAVAPTLLANSNPQLNAMGTAGIAGVSDWWWSVRRRALSDDPGAFGYVGHTAERLEVVDGRVRQHPVDVRDRSLWLSANPAVAAGRGQGMVFLEEQLRRLGPRVFGREHLCVWDPDPAELGGVTDQALDVDAWARALDPVALGRPLRMAVSADPDLTHAAIAVSFDRPDGRRHVSLGRWSAGTAWVAPAVAELRRELGCGPPVVDVPLRGIVPGDAVTPSQAAAAHNRLASRLAAGGLSHDGDGPLDLAVAGCTWRRYGETRVLARRGSLDITPLLAAALTVPPARPSGGPLSAPVAFDAADDAVNVPQVADPFAILTS